jgi:hypothetical protein
VSETNVKILSEIPPILTPIFSFIWPPPPKQLQIRALVPYSFPRAHAAADRDAMRNRWCFLSLALPVEVDEGKPRAC